VQKYAKIRYLSVFGAEVHLHWMSLVLIGGVLASTFGTPMLSALTLVSCFGIMFLHEAGHAFFARRLGYRVRGIYLNPLHGECVYDAPRSEKHRAIIAWGGVVAQLIVALPVLVAWRIGVFEDADWFGPIFVVLGLVNAATAFVNLAPSPGLDGYKAWRLFSLLSNTSGPKLKSAAPTRTRFQSRAKPQAGEAGNVVAGPWRDRADKSEPPPK
jgi:Zn-dependent protease